MSINRKTGPCVVLAGAGTGKTYSIVEKVKYLIKNKIYRPDKIVCITFSNEAANNLLSRIRKFLDSGNEPIVKTFHSFSADLLREYGGKIGISEKFNILTPEEAKVLLHRNLKVTPYYCHKYIASIGSAKDLGIGLDKLESYAREEESGYEGIDLEKRQESLKFELNTLYLKDSKDKRKELMMKINEITSLIELKKFINIWRAYEKIKTRNNYQDYSDLNNNALRLLREHKEVAGNFDYIVVDEFQDTNKVQIELIFALAYHKNITIVGDLNQSIYRFRGAYRKNFSEFRKFFNVKESEIFNLDKSFRSSNKILRLAHKLILNNYRNKEECFRVRNSYGREGKNVRVYELKNAREEARKVVELIRQELNAGSELEDICVMFRTHQQGRVIKKALEFAGIEHCSVSKSSLLKNCSVKRAIDYLEILDKLKNKKKGGEQAWWDLIYSMGFLEKDLIQIGRFIKESRDSDNISVKLFSSLDKLPLSASGRLSTKVLIEKIKILIPSAGKPVSELLPEIYAVAGLINRGESKEEKASILNLNKFFELAKAHQMLYGDELSSFVDYIETLGNLGIEISEAEIEAKGVRLMTSHSTKGLEYKTVIITNMAQKRFPTERYYNKGLIPSRLFPDLEEFSSVSKEEFESYIREHQRKHQILEERRLCYVSFTRAKENLILTYAREYAKRKHYPSQFLNEIEYKKSSDIDFFIDRDEKYVEQEPKIRKASEFGSLLLKSADFDTALINLIKNSDYERTNLSAENKIFSPSALLLFDRCQKEYEYKYVYNMPDRKTISWDAIRLGSFVHLVLEEGVKSSFSSLKDFLNFARDLQRKEEWESVDLNEAENLIKVFYERNRKKYSENSKTEQRLNMVLAGLKFTGFADRIDFSPEGLEIIDYKTGKSNVMPKNRNWQLGYYALAASKLGKVKKVTLEMLNQEKPLEFLLDSEGNAKAVHSNRMEFNIFQVESELIQTAHNIIAAYESGFKACSVEKNCAFCNEYVYNF